MPPAAKTHQPGPRPIPESLSNAAADMAAAHAAAQREREYLILVLNDNIGGAARMVHYKIRPTTKLGKLMRFHCGMMGQNLAWTRFVVTGKGVHLNQTDTAADIGIVDGDHITAVFHSYSMVSQQG